MSHDDCCKFREALEDMVDQFAIIDVHRRVRS